MPFTQAVLLEWQGVRTLERRQFHETNTFINRRTLNPTVPLPATIDRPLPNFAPVIVS